MLDLILQGGFPGGSDGKESACSAGDQGLILESGRSPGGEHGHHSSVLAWRISWTEESMGSQESDTTEQLTLPHFLNPIASMCTTSMCTTMCTAKSKT